MQANSMAGGKFKQRNHEEVIACISGGKWFSFKCTRSNKKLPRQRGRNGQNNLFHIHFAFEWTISFGVRYQSGVIRSVARARRVEINLKGAA